MKKEAFKNSLQNQTAKLFNFKPILFDLSFFYDRLEKNTPQIEVPKNITLYYSKDNFKKPFEDFIKSFTDFKHDSKFFNLPSSISPRQALIFTSEVVEKTKHGNQVFGLYCKNDIQNQKEKDDIVISDSGFLDEMIPLLDLEGYKVVHFSVNSKGFGKEKSDNLLSFKNDSRDFNLYDLKESIDPLLSRIDMGAYKRVQNHYSNINEILTTVDSHGRSPEKQRKTPLSIDELDKILLNVSFYSMINTETNLNENLDFIKNLKELHHKNGDKVIFLLNGPAGCGKDFLAQKLIDLDNSIKKSITDKSKEFHEINRDILKKIISDNRVDSLMGARHLGEVELYSSSRNNRAYYYRDLLYITSNLLENLVKQDSFIQDDVNKLTKFINDLSLSISLDKSNYFQPLTENQNHMLNNCFLKCNLINKSPDDHVKNYFIDTFKAEFPNLSKSGIIEQIYGNYIEYGESVKKEQLHLELKEFKKLIKITAFSPTLINNVLKLSKDALNDYIKIFEEHPVNYLKQPQFYEEAKQNKEIIADLFEISKSLKIKVESTRNKSNKDLEQTI